MVFLAFDSSSRRTCLRFRQAPEAQESSTFSERLGGLLKYYMEVQAESARDPLPSGTGEARRTRRQRPHPGRQELPADLPRVERVIDCTPQQCQCSHCGQARTVIGYETSEQLDVEPAKYLVLVTKREKRACRHCEQGGVVAAPVPARIIAKGLVSDRVVIDTVISKYSDHLPLYRQSVMLERETGLEIAGPRWMVG
jgi:transposase